MHMCMYLIYISGMIGGFMCEYTSPHSQGLRIFGLV